MKNVPGHCFRLFAGKLLHPFATGLQSVHLRLIEPTPGALRLFVHIEMHEVAEGVRLLAPAPMAAGGAVFPVGRD